jgi:hypothetical protein
MQNAKRKQQINKAGCRWQAMNELFKVCLMLWHHLNVYQLFKIPSKATRPITCCRISWGIVATAAAGNTAGRERCADTKISGIEVLSRENTYVIICLVTCSRIWADWHFLIAIAVFQDRDLGRGRKWFSPVSHCRLPAYRMYYCLILYAKMYH